MSGFSHKYNTDQSVIRYAIIGLLRYLNKTVEYTYQITDNDTKTIKVAFLYDMAGDERFYQDLFIQPGWKDCEPDFIEGNYEYIPRGMIKLSNIIIPTAEIVNRFVRASYTVENNGAIEKRNAQLNSLPFNLSFEAEVFCDTLNEALGITERILEVLFKNIVFHINYNGYIVPCRAGLPDNYTIQKAAEFTFQVGEPIKIMIPIEMSTYKPIPDVGSDRSDANRIYTFKHNYEVGTTKDKENLILTSQDLQSINTDYIIYTTNTSTLSIDPTSSSSDKCEC